MAAVTSRAYSAAPAADAPAQSMMIPMADMANHVHPPAESAALLVARSATPIAWDAKPRLWAAPRTPEDPSPLKAQGQHVVRPAALARVGHSARAKVALQRPGAPRPHGQGPQ